MPECPITGPSTWLLPDKDKLNQVRIRALKLLVRAVFLSLLPQTSPSHLMSGTHSTASSSSGFNSIINSALEVYEKRTKKNLLSHPLTEQLQNCDSPGAILLVLQQQVQEINHSQSSDERLTKWLDPTVNVLYAFTEVLGEGVGLVCFRRVFRL